MKVRTSVLRGFALLALSSLTFAACDDKTTDIAPLPVTVSVTPQTLNLQVGQSAPLVAIVQNAQNQNVTWTSANSAVATVDANGNVTAVTAGTAVITAASVENPNARAAAAVVVTPAPPANITLQLVPATASVQVGSTVQLVSVVGGTTNQAVTYESSATGVATVNAQGLVTGVAPGTAVITARTAATPQAVATSVITVTAAPPVTPPTITIAPAQATAQVGGTQQFVATVTGAQNTAVMWRSESPSVATVNQQGLATAVAPGTAVITAMAAADTTRRVTATLTVVATPPVTQPAISIQTVQTVPGNVSQNPGATVAGNIRVRVNVSAGSEALVQRVEIRLGETVACQQSFQPPLTATQGVQEIECVINTAQLDPETGMALFMNATYQLTAVAIGTDGEDIATANWGQLTLNNANVMTILELTTTPRTSTEPVAGQTGGTQGVVFNEGDVVVTVQPVIFSGAAIQTVQVCVGPQDGPVAGSEACRAATAGAANVWTATFPKDSANAPRLIVNNGVGNVTTTDLRARATSVRTNTVAGPGQAGYGNANQIATSIAVDNVAPGATVTPGAITPIMTVAIPAGIIADQNRWVGAGYTFTAANWVTNGADVLPGVGGVTYQFFVRAVPTGTDNLTAAQVISGGTQVATANDLPETLTNQEYILAVRAIDALGNARTARTAVGQYFGVDRTVPQISVVTGPPTNVVNPVAPSFTFSIADTAAAGFGGSGFGVDPFFVQIIRYYAGTNTPRCVNVNTGNVTNQAGGTCPFVQLTGSTVNVPAVEGYLQIRMEVRDQAGNRSAQIERLIMQDFWAPNVVVSTTTTTNNQITLIGTASDSVDLRSIVTRMAFAGAPAPTIVNGGIGAGDGTMTLPPVAVVGQFGIPERTWMSEFNRTTTMWGALHVTDQTGVLTGSFQGTGAAVGAFDVAGNFNQSGFAAPAVPGVIGAAPAGFQSLTIAAANASICNGVAPVAALAFEQAGAVACGTNVPASTAVTITATGPTGTFQNPFTEVHLFRVDRNGIVRWIGQAGAPAAFELVGPTRREYRWTINLAGAGIPAQANMNIFALGVFTDGANGVQAIRSPTTSVTVQGSVIRVPPTN